MARDEYKAAPAELRRLLSAGEGYASIARRYDVGPNTVRTGPKLSCRSAPMGGPERSGPAHGAEPQRHLAQGDRAELQVLGADDLQRRPCLRAADRPARP